MTHEERKQRREQIAEAIKAGKSNEEIVKLFGVSASMISLVRREHGLPLVEVRRPEYEKTYNLMAALLASDKTLLQLGEEFGVTRERVRQIKERMADAGMFKAAKCGREFIDHRSGTVELLQAEVARLKEQIEYWKDRKAMNRGSRRQDDVVADIQSGLTVKQTAEKNHIGVCRVYQILKANNVDAPASIGPDKIRVIFQACKMMTPSASMNHIVRAMKLSPKTVRTIWIEAHRAGLISSPVPTLKETE